jgi:hypothetical protein
VRGRLLIESILRRQRTREEGERRGRRERHTQNGGDKAGVVFVENIIFFSQRGCRKHGGGE